MRFNNLSAGVAFIVLAAVMASAAWGLPNPSQQPLGPSAFPLILSGLLALCATIMAVNGAFAGSTAALFTRSEWTRSRASMLRLLLVPAVVVFFISCAEPLGFLVAAPLILAALFLASGVGPALAVPLSMGAALVMHSIFYLGLGVQLPWGLLEPVRW